MYNLRIYVIFSVSWMMLVHHVHNVVGKDDSQKRLLLNDPDVVGHRLAQLESTQQTLQQTITTLQSINQRQDLVIANLNYSVSTLQTTNVQLEAETVRLKTQLQKQDQEIQANKGHGGTFVRWGRTTCPGTNTELVYSGYAAGQNYVYSASYYGGPANMVCLPKDPELTNTTFAYTDIPLMGTEYERNTFSKDSHNNNMPCAVCVSLKSATSIVVPARQTCYSGWQLEYKGLLASGHKTHTASSYICVDGQPEYIPGGEKDENGHLMYVANYQCDPLPCPPYHNSHYVTCVVCSK